MTVEINYKSFGLSETVVDKIHAIFQTYPEINHVILYGSRAKGNYTLSSDIDLCIEAAQLNLTQLLKIENQLDDLCLPWKIDLSLKHKIDNQALLDHVRDVGVVFYP
jgi:predicted nucleotidyltransferase